MQLQVSITNINKEIKSSIVLLIDENGKNIGKVGINDALTLAKSVGLDLVEINNSSCELPVCRIMNFGKWRYEQSKKIKKNTQQKQQIKEIKFRPNTSDNDLIYRAKHADKFLSVGYKVKLTVRFRGREHNHMYKTGKILLEKFLELVKEKYVFDNNTKVEGSCIVLLLSPLSEDK